MRTVNFVDGAVTRAAWVMLFVLPPMLNSKGSPLMRMAARTQEP